MEFELLFYFCKYEDEYNDKEKLLFEEKNMKKI